MDLSECSRAFIRGLLWTCVGPSRGERVVVRRLGLPTWCWASLAGEISCVGRVYANDREDVAIEAEDFNGSTFDIGRMPQRNAGKGKVIEELTRYIHVTAFVAQVTIVLGKPKGGPGNFNVELNSGSAPPCQAELSIDVFTDPSLMARFQEKRIWEVLVLPEVGNLFSGLVLEYEGLTAYRLGRLIPKEFHWDGWSEGFRVADFSGEVKTVRLG